VILLLYVRGVNHSEVGSVRGISSPYAPGDNPTNKETTEQRTPQSEPAVRCRLAKLLDFWKITLRDFFRIYARTLDRISEARAVQSDEGHCVGEAALL
jgi:hypothetical protein